MRQYDAASGTNRGPLAVYVRVRYDQGIVWWPQPDPSVAVLPYTVSVAGPLGPSTFSGSVTVSIGGYTQDVRMYPGDGVFPIPPGTYSFTLTVFGNDGSTSATRQLTVT